MKAHLINTHLLVPRSRSSAKVKVKYQDHVSQKMGISGALVFHKHILFFSSTGQRAYVMVCCLSCVRLSVRPSVRPCVNFFFKHLLLWNYLSDFDGISQKCSCHGPLQNFLKKFHSVKNCGCHGNKTEKKMKTLKIFLWETIRVRATKFGM